MKTTVTNEQFFKLPKWAKLEITSLRNNIEYLKKQAAQLNGSEQTNTFIREGIDRKPLPKNSCIEFNTGNNKVHVYIRNDGTIDVNTSGSDTTVILPRATNSFYISFVKID